MEPLLSRVSMRRMEKESARLGRQWVLAIGLGLSCVLMAGGALAHGRDNDRDNRHSLVRWPSGIAGTVEGLKRQVTGLQTQVTTLTNANTALQSSLTSAQAAIAALQSKVAALEAHGGGGAGGGGAVPPVLSDLAKYLKVEPNAINGVNGPHVILTGVNLHLRSGSGSTDESQTASGQPLGLGNLIVGYNELNPTGGLRTGSHNIVGGSFNNFSSVGGLIVGVRGTINGQYATVLGGDMNMASGVASSVLGGFRTFATAPQQRVPQ